MSRFISKVDANRLLKKLYAKYAAEYEVLKEQMELDKRTYGFVTMETELKQEALINKIKEEETRYN